VHQSNPCLGYHVGVSKVAREAFLLLSDKGPLLVTGELYASLLPKLDGSRSFVELISEIEHIAGYGQVIDALKVLEKNGLLSRNHTIDEPSNKIAYFDELGIDRREYLQNLKTNPVSLAQEDKNLRSALQLAEVCVVDSAMIIVHRVNDYLETAFARDSIKAKRDGKASIPVRLVGASVWVGPKLNMSDGPCWECMAYRIRRNRRFACNGIDSSLAAEITPARLGQTEMSRHTASIIAAQYISEVVGDPTSELKDRILRVDLRTFQSTLHFVQRRPQCAVCGDPLRAPTKLESIVSADAAFNVQRMLEFHAKNANNITGVVSHLVETTTDDSGLWHTFSAGHFIPTVRGDPRAIARSLRPTTGGKGRTKSMAQTSAIGEAIERSSTIFDGSEVTVSGRWCELSDRAVNPATLLNFSESQYRHRKEWNGNIRGSRFHFVPRPFDPEAVISWARGRSLISGRERLIPAAYCFFGHPEVSNEFFISDSNGCAAGATFADAIVSGALELIERDAVAIWWYNRIGRKGLELNYDDPYLICLKSYYASIGRDLWALDVTTDLNVPTVVALSRQREGAEDIIFGSAAAFSFRMALRGAVSELNQFLPAVVRNGPSAETRYNFPETDALEWWKCARVETEHYLQPLGTSSYCDRVVEHGITENFFEKCLPSLRDAGLDVIVVNLSRPDIGIPVCRVVIPGLRHFWRRLGQGRLYDVPVKMGLVSSPCLESELNPYSIFF
jgi:ribosomal protein S12 methylthiotransferase accessory factor